MPDSVADIVRRFALVPHPEGGFFREVHRSPLVIDHPALDATAERRRSSGTFIYFLLASGDFSAFHRVRASDEIDGRALAQVVSDVRLRVLLRGRPIAALQAIQPIV